MTNDEAKEQALLAVERTRFPSKQFAAVIHDNPGLDLQRVLKTAAGLSDEHKLKSITCECESTKIVKFTVEIWGDYQTVANAVAAAQAGRTDEPVAGSK